MNVLYQIRDKMTIKINKKCDLNQNLFVKEKFGSTFYQKYRPIIPALGKLRQSKASLFQKIKLFVQIVSLIPKVVTFAV